MLSKEQKLEAIYEAMADKTLSVGCLCYLDDAVFYSVCKSDKVTTEQDSLILYRHSDDEYYSITSIIWNPVRIGDVLDWFDKNNHNHLWWGNWVINWGIITRQWDHLRLPIDEQSEGCIDFVYSLISNSRIS